MPRNQENGPPDLLDIPLPELYYDSVGLGEKAEESGYKVFLPKSPSESMPITYLIPFTGIFSYHYYHLSGQTGCFLEVSTTEYQ
ncbi:hypothetical protein ACFFJX_20550 [Pseudarcicella hirudinis]|uniref:hypothetical protein n=1 Tax=Pseudarcicella hirudinis TaxID=1079859 RepID=UPI0035ECC0B7